MNTQTNIDINIDFGRMPTGKVEARARKESLFFRFVKTCFVTCALTYFLICLMYICFQDSLLYKPVNNINRVPVQVGHSFMNLVLNSESEHINAWFTPAPQNKGTVLFCRSSKGNMSDDVDLIEAWNRNGYNVMTFDYRGFGQSTGTPSEENCYSDVRAAYAWLKQKGLTKKRFIIHGFGLGGSVASKIAMEVECDGVILESAFTDLKELTKMRFPVLPTSLICFSTFPTANRLQSINAPIMIIHSPENEVIPYKMGRMLYEAAPQPKIFYPSNNWNNDSPSMSASYSRSLSSFANSLSQR
jgi:uncharacterized protein